jgi:general nucleoside transport system ATP-binding protein
MCHEKVLCLPEEPRRNACMGRMTVAENLAFRNYDRSPFIAANRFVKSTEPQRN